MIAKVTFEIDLGGLIDTSIDQYQEQAHNQVVNLLFQSAITKYLMSSMRNISHPTGNAHADAMFQVDCDNNVCIIVKARETIQVEMVDTFTNSEDLVTC